MIPIITIEGATAVGKSALAIELARSLQTEIISADSRQVYKHLNIGTAKPDMAQQKAVKHHLIDILELDESYNAGRFCADVIAIAGSLHKHEIIPIVCGGTGLYIKTLLEGLFVSPMIPAQIRADLLLRLENENLAALYEELKQIDPVFADRISASDRQRIQRGLEVFQATGKPISIHWQEQKTEPVYKPFRILVQDERNSLYQRINLRVVKMLEAGLLEEISALLKQGFSKDTLGLKTLGYKEFMPYLIDGGELQNCIDQTAQHTRNYAKRQITWYQKYDFHLTLLPSEFTISNVRDLIRAYFD